MSTENTNSITKVNEKTRVSEIQIDKYLEKQKRFLDVLPKNITLNKLNRVLLTEIAKNPKLRDCTLMSFLSAVVQALQFSLIPGSVFGHAYLVPYGNECQFILGYKGMISLILRSEEISNIYAAVIYKGEHYVYELGLNRRLEHIPRDDISREPEDIIAAYVVAELSDGKKTFDFMFISEIEKIKERSKAKNSGPWITDKSEMCKKTVVRRFSKYLPVSTEVTEAIEKDYQADLGEQKNSTNIFDGEFERIDSEDAGNKKTKSDQIANKISTNLNNKPSTENNNIDKETGE